MGQTVLDKNFVRYDVKVLSSSRLLTYNESIDLCLRRHISTVTSGTQVHTFAFFIVVVGVNLDEFNVFRSTFCKQTYMFFSFYVLSPKRSARRTGSANSSVIHITLVRHWLIREVLRLCLCVRVTNELPKVLVPEKGFLYPRCRRSNSPNGISCAVYLISKVLFSRNLVYNRPNNIHSAHAHLKLSRTSMRRWSETLYDAQERILAK